MVIDQRNAGASVTPASGQYLLDRWLANASQSSKYSVQQNAGSITPPNGFVNYLGVTSLSAYSITSGDYFNIAQKIEGFNIADLNWGTANAKTVTLSFQVYSSLTGTFGGAICNGAQTRSFPFTYTVSAANTWTPISVTITGDTTGTWATNNTAGMQVFFNLGTGSTYSNTAGTWASGNYISATGATSVVGTSSATFYITGVQLEVGTQATTFDYRSYNQEFYFCQRYFYKNICATGGQQSTPLAPMGWTYTTSRLYVPVIFPQPMRGTPTLSKAGGLGYNPNIGSVVLTDMIIQDASNVAANIQANSSAGFTNNTAYWIGPNTVASDFIAFSAEL
jgi:hypothetical protein